MLNKILANKRIVTIAIVFILILLVGIVILVTFNSKHTGVKDTNTKTEQSDGDVATRDDNKRNESSELEVLNPDAVAPGDYSDASGSWETS